MSETIEIQVICDFEPVTIQVFEGGDIEGVTVHNLLTGRDADDQHPISSITGLIAALNAKLEGPLSIADITDLATALLTAQKAIAGIVDFDLTAVAGDTHTITILPEHSGKALDIRANLDDVVTIIVGNDIVIEQPITLRLTGVFSRELRAANTDIVIEANDVLDDAGVAYVDITGEAINTVQIMRKSNNLIWVI